MQKALKAYSTAQLYYNQLEPIMWSIDPKNWLQEAVALNKDGTLEHLNSGFCASFYRWMVGSPPCQLLIRKFHELNEQAASASTKNERKVTKLQFNESCNVTVQSALEYIKNIQGYAKPHFDSLAKECISETNAHSEPLAQYQAIKSYLDTHSDLDAITRPKVLDQIISLLEDTRDAAEKELAQEQAKCDQQNQTKCENIRKNRFHLWQLSWFLSSLEETY